MDADRFDRLTLSFAEIRARRGLLRSAAAAVVGLAGLTGLGGPGFGSDPEVAANRKKKGKSQNKKKCKGKNKKKCNGICAKIKKDPENCGDCGIVCPDDAPSCQKGSCTCLDECCVDEDCEGTEVCQSGSCVCLDECCVDEDCPTGGVCDPNGTCDCGQCCFNDDCAPNENCVLVGDSRFCFCKPEQVCGQVCCPAGLDCVNPQTSSCA